MGCTHSTSSAAAKEAALKSRNQQQQLSSGSGGFAAASPQTMISVKQVPESEVAKHRVNDLPAFVKAGNLSMVHALVGYYGLGIEVMLAKVDIGDDVVIWKNPTIKVSTAGWNPFMVAVAFKRTEIVRYFLEDLKISQKMLCKDLTFPQTHPFSQLPPSVQAQLYPMQLAIINHDLPTLQELWNNQLYFLTEVQEVTLSNQLQSLLSEKWLNGLQAILNSHVTVTLFQNLQDFSQQVALMTNWHQMRKQVNGELGKAMDDAMGRRPFSLATLVSLLTTDPDKITDHKHLLDKCLTSLDLASFGKFKLSPDYSLFHEKLAQLEGTKAIVLKLRETFAKLNEELSIELPSYNSGEAYALLMTRIGNAMSEGGDMGQLEELVRKYDIKSIPQGTLLQSVTNEDRFHTVLEVLYKNGFTRLALTDLALQAAEKNQAKLFQFLLEDHRLLNDWTVDQVTNLLWQLFAQRNLTYLNTLFQSTLFANYFTLLLPTTQERQKLIFSLLISLYKEYGSYTSEHFDIFTHRYISPYFLVELIERDTYMKLGSFDLFNKCLTNSTQFELEQLSQSQENEERFIRFMKYVEILSEEDPKRIEGKKLIDRIFNLDKFKELGTVGASMQLYDNESQILEEEGIVDEGGAHSVQVAMMVHGKQQRQRFKQFDVKRFFSFFPTKHEAEIIAMLKQYQLQDLYFLRQFSPMENTVLDQCWNLQDDGTFVEAILDVHGQLNLLQLAIHYNLRNLFKYLLFDHKPQQDTRMILSTTHPSQDPTFTLRLALQLKNQPTFLTMWCDFPYLYSHEHLLPIARFIMHPQIRAYELIPSLLQAETTKSVFANAPQSMREEFARVIGEINVAQSYIKKEPYIQEEEEKEDVVGEMYAYIKDNDADRLKELVINHNIKGIGSIFFNLDESDRELLSQVNQPVVSLSILNPVLLCIKYRAFQCLKYLLSAFPLRPSIHPADLIIHPKDQEQEYHFSQWLLPILLKVKDIEALTYLLKQPGFWMEAKDFKSFLAFSLSEKWVTGLKIFLESKSGHYFFTSLFTYDQQRDIISSLIKSVCELQDPKLKKSFSQTIIEDTLSKRPYAQHLTLLLLQETTCPIESQLKMARECLKTVTTEDLWHLYMLGELKGPQPLMEEIAVKYKQVQESESALKKELGKIVQRYANEVLPEIAIVSQRSGEEGAALSQAPMEAKRIQQTDLNPIRDDEDDKE